MLQIVLLVILIVAIVKIAAKKKSIPYEGPHNADLLAYEARLDLDLTYEEKEEEEKADKIIENYENLRSLVLDLRRIRQTQTLRKAG